MKTPDQIAAEESSRLRIGPIGGISASSRKVAYHAALAAILADRTQRDTDWTGSRPVLMRKGDIIVVGTRMGPWGGVFVSDPEKVMGLPKELPSGLHTNDYRPKVGLAELPDATWASLGWTITEAR